MEVQCKKKALYVFPKSMGISSCSRLGIPSQEGLCIIGCARLVSYFTSGIASFRRRCRITQGNKPPDEKQKKRGDGKKNRSYAVFFYAFSVVNRKYLEPIGNREQDRVVMQWGDPAGSAGKKVFDPPTPFPTQRVYVINMNIPQSTRCCLERARHLHKLTKSPYAKRRGKKRYERN